MTLTQRLFSYGSLFGVIVAALAAGCASPPGPAPEMDSQVGPTLKQMCDFLDESKSLRFRVHALADRYVDTGQLAQFQRTSDITLVRPDRLYAQTDSDDGSWALWYRLGKVTVLDKDSAMYATETAPGRVDQMLDYLVEEFDLVMPMADLLVGKTYDSLLANVECGTYEGLHVVGDVSCHHLLFRQENIDWQLWIDAGPQPVPRKLVITYTQEPDEPEYVAVMDDWDMAPQVSPETFTFTPPIGANPVTMSELLYQE